MAVEKVVSVKLQAKVDGFVAGFEKAKASVDGLAKADTVTPQKAFKGIADKAALMGGVVAVGVAKAVMSFADFDSAMSGAAAATNATSDKLGELRDAAIIAGKDTQFSATEAAQGITEMAKAGVDADEILSGGLKGALDLAAAGQLDVASASEIAATALNQFNLEGEDLPHVADLYAAAAGKAQGSVQDIAQAMEYAGVTANSLGVSIEETTGVIGLFASKGIIGEKAGTTFRSMLLSLTAPSKAAAKAMEEYGINVFDASGKFIGMQGAAEQLKARLGPLDEATRTAALGQIFGNEAIGGAIQLYEAGGAGVKDWTDKVNDSGFAAEQAAKLTDNLKGDMERLSGSLETVFIQAGSGANDMLRSLVQGAGSLVDIIGNIPGPVLLAATSLSGLALLVPRGLIAFRNYQEQLKGLGLSMDQISAKSPRAAGALKLLGSATVVTTVAALATSLTDMAAAAQVGTPETEKLAASLVAVADGAEQAGAFSDLFARGIGPFRQEFATTAEAIEEFGANARIALDPSMLETFFGDASGASEIFTKRVGEIDKALQQMVAAGNAEQAAALVQKLTDAAVAQGVPIDSLKGKFPAYEAAVKAAGEASAAAAPEMGKLSPEVEAIKLSAEDAKSALDDLLTTIEGFGSPLAQQRAASREYESAIDDAKEAVKEQTEALVENRLKMQGIEKPTKDQTAAAKEWATAQIKAGAGLDITTEAGRANQTALDKIHGATLKNVTSTFNLTGSTDDAAAAMKRGREAFIKAAVAAGMGKTQADNLADSLGLIPKDVETQIGLSGVASTHGQIDATTGKLTTLDRKTAVPGVRAQVDGASFAYAEYKLDQVARGRTATITARVNDAASGVLRGIAAIAGSIGRASGGPIVGPGTGTSDSILMRGSNGEHVWTAAEVAAAGGHGAIFAMRKAILSGGVERHASGGPVGVSAITVRDSRRVAPVGIDYGRLASALAASVPAPGPSGPLLTIGNVTTVDENRAANAILNRFGDAMNMSRLGR